MSLHSVTKFCKPLVVYRFLMHDVISLPDAASYDNYDEKVLFNHPSFCGHTIPNVLVPNFGQLDNYLSVPHHTCFHLLKTSEINFERNNISFLGREKIKKLQ